MRREIFTYKDLESLPESRLFQQIRKYPIVAVSADMRKALKGRFEKDRIKGLFGQDRQVRVTDLHALVSAVDPAWGSDRKKFDQLVILSEFLRGKIAEDGEDVKKKRWLTGCLRNLNSLHSAIKLLEEARIKPQDIECGNDRNLSLLAEAWQTLIDRDPEILAYRSRMDAMGRKDAWTSILSELFYMSDVSDVDTIVFMGLYYITPQQEYVMRQLEAAGFRLIFYIPYNEHVPFVHEVWDKTYAEENGYPPKAEWHMEAVSGSDPWGDIFEGKEVRLPNRVKIREYATDMEFINDISRIREEGYSLYSSDAQAVDRLLKEYYPEDYGERKALSYPVGQFINVLNGMWDEETQCVTLDENLLIEAFSSGWLAKDGVSGRTYIKDLFNILPFFKGCLRASEWNARADYLEKIYTEVLSAFKTEEDPDPDIARWQEGIRSPLTQISIFSVPREKLDILLSLIRQLLSMAGELFESTEMVSIQEHVHKLDYILRENEVSNEMYEEERELVAEIFETLERPGLFETKCYPSDIARALNLYVTGRLSEGEIQAYATGLVNPLFFVDAAPVKAGGKVHVCSCDVEHMPGKNKEYIWPLTKKTVEKALDKTGNILIRNMMHIMEVSDLYNRYFLYSALKNRDVEISWIGSTNEKLLAPSSYVKLISEAASIPVMPTIRAGITYKKVTRLPYAEAAVNDYEYEKMPLETVKEARMDYVLCPMKYVLGYVTERYPVFQSDFQQTYALNAIIAAVYDLMKDDGITERQVYENLIALFPNLRRIEKRQVYDYIANSRRRFQKTEDRTKSGKWLVTDERLKIHYPGAYARKRGFELYGKQETPDKQDGMNLFRYPGSLLDNPAKLQEVCAFCPEINNCRNALYSGDEERLYD